MCNDFLPPYLSIQFVHLSVSLSLCPSFCPIIRELINQKRRLKRQADADYAAGLTDLMWSKEGKQMNERTKEYKTVEQTSCLCFGEGAETDRQLGLDTRTLRQVLKQK